MEPRNLIKLISSLAIPQLAGILGSLFTVPSIPTWYASLPKPAFSPPNWVFAPVWTSLFILMGISLYMVWSMGLDKRDSRLAVAAFGVQLALNVAWSALFFGLRSPFLALIEIALLWAAIAVNIYLFQRLSMRAGLLLVPYIMWVSFAAFLNYSIWIISA